MGDSQQAPDKAALQKRLEQLEGNFRQLQDSYSRLELAINSKAAEGSKWTIPSLSTNAERGGPRHDSTVDNKQDRSVDFEAATFLHWIFFTFQVPLRLFIFGTFAAASIYGLILFRLPFEQSAVRPVSAAIGNVFCILSCIGGILRCFSRKAKASDYSTLAVFMLVGTIGVVVSISLRDFCLALVPYTAYGAAGLGLMVNLAEREELARAAKQRLPE